MRQVGRECLRQGDTEAKQDERDSFPTKLGKVAERSEVGWGVARIGHGNHRSCFRRSAPPTPPPSRLCRPTSPSFVGETQVALFPSGHPSALPPNPQPL